MTPDTFAASSKRLWNELVSLHDAWAQYQYLFGESAERVELLNRCARWYFGLTQRLLLREVVLSISRLTDPLKRGAHDNLVIATLLLDPHLDEYPGLREELTAIISKAATLAAPIRAHRNKYIAHLDRATALNSQEAPLPSLHRDAVSAALNALEEAYNLHGTRTADRHSLFRFAPTGGADALVALLERCVDAQPWSRPNAI